MTNQAFLNQLVGRTIHAIEVVSDDHIVIHFTDGSAVAIKADTVNTHPILRYEEKAEPTAVQLKGIA